VFVPSLTTSRFPSSRTGRPRDWLVPRHLLSPQRYEGCGTDEAGGLLRCRSLLRRGDHRFRAVLVNRCIRNNSLEVQL
jgi:hypothetical protein